VTHVEIDNLTVSIIEKGGEARLALRTSWGTGLTIPTDRIPEIIHALKQAERAARRVRARSDRGAV
jgi:hypothetical protein